MIPSIDMSNGDSSKCNEVLELEAILWCQGVSIYRIAGRRKVRSHMLPNNLQPEYEQLFQLVNTAFEIALYMLNDMMAFTISESCSFSALTAFFLDTLA